VLPLIHSHSPKEDGREETVLQTRKHVRHTRANIGDSGRRHRLPQPGGGKRQDTDTERRRWRKRVIEAQRYYMPVLCQNTEHRKELNGVGTFSLLTTLKKHERKNTARGWQATELTHRL
jgi:hypothetical protein